MKIAQFGRFSSATVNGVSQAGYHLVKALSQIGVSVRTYAVGGDKPSDEEIHLETFQQTSRLNPFAIPSKLKEALTSDRPDLVHLHSVFTPMNVALAAFLRKISCPYVVTPHGGYNPHVFAKGRLKKWLFWSLYERTLLLRANGVICLAAKEEQDIRRVGYRGPTACIPNPVPPPSTAVQRQSWEPTILFMGRWDIHGKGIDRLLSLFQKVEAIDPGIKLELRGVGNEIPVRETIARLGLRSAAICEPLFGSAKWDRLSQISLYIQPSRWEVFGMAIAEAMLAGVPVAISRDCYISSNLAEQNCCLLLDRYDENMAGEVCDAVRNHEINQKLGERGRCYAIDHFDPLVVARKTRDFYVECLHAGRSRRPEVRRDGALPYS